MWQLSVFIYAFYYLSASIICDSTLPWGALLSSPDPVLPIINVIINILLVEVSCSQCVIHTEFLSRALIEINFVSGRSMEEAQFARRTKIDIQKSFNALST